MYAADLNDLLAAELRVFLGETLAREKLSSGAESTRLRLLTVLHKRSKSPSPPAYLDMTRSSPRKSMSSDNDIRCGGGNSLVSCYEPVMPDVLERSGTCGGSSGSSGGGSGSGSVVAVSASALRYCAVHSGSLGRRTRLLFLEQVRKYWAALSHKTLYLYSSDADPKPISHMDLNGYQARPLMPNTKKDYTFELISPGNKTYQFVASSLRDMETWVEAVNLACKEEEFVREETPRELPSVPPQETYDTPDSRIRPVILQDYEPMSHQDSLYQCIDDKHHPVPVPQEQLYKNVGVVDEYHYYNMGPRREFIMEETIYQTISEEKPCGMMANSMHQTRDAQLYEPVSAGNEDSRASR